MRNITAYIRHTHTHTQKKEELVYVLALMNSEVYAYMYVWLYIPLQLIVGIDLSSTPRLDEVSHDTDCTERERERYIYTQTITLRRTLNPFSSHCNHYPPPPPPPPFLVYFDNYTYFVSSGTTMFSFRPSSSLNSFISCMTGLVLVISPTTLSNSICAVLLSLNDPPALPKTYITSKSLIWV